eukprot:2891171-Prymnesium_polylepis.1
MRVASSRAANKRRARGQRARSERVGSGRARPPASSAPRPIRNESARAWAAPADSIAWPRPPRTP